MIGLRGDGALAQQKFPNDPIFTRLRQLSMKIPGVLFHDEYGIDASYSDLVSDVIHLRHVLREQLPKTSFNEQGCLQNNAVSIAFLAFSGYYFIVSFLAIAALGGVCVPLSTEVTTEEALYFLNKTKATYILVDGGTFDNASKIKDYARNQNGQNLNLIPITRAELESSPCSPELEIDEELTFSPSLGCLVLFTSGTTGLPKGVVLPRQLFDFTAYQQPPAILYLASCPVHWIGGTGLIDSVLTGEKLHIMKNGPTPSRFWEVLREGKVTEMSVSPTLLRQLMEYYIENISDLPTEERERYINGAKTLQRVYTSGSMLNPSTRQFFANLTNMPITNAYGITEMGGGITATPAGSIFEEGYIGTPLPGIIIKLSDGDHGEVLVKSPNMFIRYVDDEAATRAAFDDEGFYKTGDRAHRVGDDYYFDGRVSCDWIRFHEYTIPIVELELRLMDLPYLSEAHVLPVLDHETGGLVAALVRLQKQTVNQIYGDITLRRIREDLAARNMASYKLPVLLRVLRDHEQVPLTASGKALKKESLRKYFNISGYLPDQYAVDGVENWGNKLDTAASTRLFDWGGY